MEGLDTYPATFDVSGRDCAFCQAEISSETIGRSYLPEIQDQQSGSLEDGSNFESLLIKAVCERELHEPYGIPRSRIKFKRKKEKRKKRKTTPVRTKKTIEERQEATGNKSRQLWGNNIGVREVGKVEWRLLLLLQLRASTSFSSAVAFSFFYCFFFSSLSHSFLISHGARAWPVVSESILTT
jgi:hypothetical protein